MKAPLPVDRLWPEPAGGLTLDEAFAALQPPPPRDGRPGVAINMVTSIDGRAQLDGRADGLGSRADRRLMQLYRAAFDAVASGAGTLRADDFYSRIRSDLAERRRAAGREAQPVAILIAGAAPLPPGRRWFGYADQPRILVVGAGNRQASAEALPGVETWVAPDDEPRPDWLLQRLGAAGIGSLLLEGGPTLNAAFLAVGAVDELYWTIGPRLVANQALPMVAAIDPGGLQPPAEARLLGAHRCGDELFLRYGLR